MHDDKLTSCHDMPLLNNDALSCKQQNDVDKSIENALETSKIKKN